jgi:16S rRNA (uracil1498-N3)-methyltransferase
MKIHRFIDNFDLSKNEIEITGKIAHQIVKVLKLKAGEKVELSDGKGVVAFGKIKKIEKSNVTVEKEKIIKEEENKKIVLYCAILKKENFELVVQKTTECGISKVVPIISARTIKTGLNLERLQKIAKEASEQSGRSTVPEISEPIAFTKAIEIVEGKSVLFDISGSKFTSNYNLETKNLFIGPEGGWTEEEIKRARNISSFKICSLGKITLRAETAAIISTYLISNL